MAPDILDHQVLALIENGVSSDLERAERPTSIFLGP
jgi:hypothetical protein